MENAKPGTVCRVLISYFCDFLALFVQWLIRHVLLRYFKETGRDCFLLVSRWTRTTNCARRKNGDFGLICVLQLDKARKVLPLDVERLRRRMKVVHEPMPKEKITLAERHGEKPGSVEQKRLNTLKQDIVENAQTLYMNYPAILSSVNSDGTLEFRGLARFGQRVRFLIFSIM